MTYKDVVLNDVKHCDVVKFDDIRVPLMYIHGIDDCHGCYFESWSTCPGPCTKGFWVPAPDTGKEIPMKVTDIHVDEFYCPACGNEVCIDNKRVWQNYCPYCGQRIYQEKTGEEEE